MTPGFILIVVGVLIIMLVMRRHVRLTGRRNREVRRWRHARSRRANTPDVLLHHYGSTITDGVGQTHSANIAVHDDTVQPDTGDCSSGSGSDSGGDCGGGGGSSD